MATEAEILKVLAEERNMRKAAERLFLSQPALSQRCKRLKRIGERNYLFVRKKD